MRNFLVLVTTLLLTTPVSYAQKLWTETDRQYTLDNLRRTRDELVRETENLTPAQWAFHESADRWNIGEVVEHLALWEIIWAREISMGSRSKPQPELNQTSKPDSYYHEFIWNQLPIITRFFRGQRASSKVKITSCFFCDFANRPLALSKKPRPTCGAHFELTATDSPRNMHQVYIYQWGHVDRHLRQIRKIKQHPNYPSVSISNK